MHQRILLALLLLVSSTFVMCKSDSTGTTGGTNNTTTGVTAKVNGAAWSATNVQSSWSNNALGIGGASINGAANNQINISGLVSAPGTYQLGAFTGIIGSYTEGSATGAKIFMATSGTIVVTELSSTGAKGTFAFEATENNGTGKRSITDGNFNVKF